MYEAKSTFEQKTYTFSKEQRPGVNSITPGPGAYDERDEVVRSGSKKATIG